MAKVKNLLFFWVITLLFAPLPALGEARFDEGQWRVEGFIAPGVASGSSSRDGDIMFNGTIEYEFPLAPRTTLGLRMMPLFVYTQSNDDKTFLGVTYEDDNDETVYGAGAGLALRFYSVKDEYRGFFGEIEGQFLGHSGNFEGNGSNFNFLTGAGVGYKFPKDVSLFVKYNHISNSGISDDNRGVNTVGMGVGYNF